MTDFTAYTAYECRHCHADAIRPRESPEALDEQCTSCWRLPTLEDTNRRGGVP